MNIVMHDEALCVGKDRRGRELSVATSAKVLDRSRNLLHEIRQRDDRNREVFGKNPWIENVSRTEPQLRPDVASDTHRFRFESTSQRHGASILLHPLVAGLDHFLK